MMAIIIGKNHVAYLRVRKKDINLHFFKYRNQFYPVYPDELTPCEMWHDGAWTNSESVIVFAENVGIPLNCKHPARYGMDSVLASIDEHKLMAKKRRKWSLDLTPAKIWEWIPLVIMGCIGLAVLMGMLS